MQWVAAVFGNHALLRHLGVLVSLTQYTYYVARLHSVQYYPVGFVL